MTSRERNLLRDLLPAILDRARMAGAEARRTSSTTLDGALERGRALAYYEVLTKALSQLDAFGIERNEVGLPAELDLERELLVE